MFNLAKIIPVSSNIFMKKILLLSWAILLYFTGFSQNEYYLPKKNLNLQIPTPEQFLGYPIGSHHTRYDKLVEYMRVLEKASNRVKVVTIGETNEHREQIIVHFAKPENLSNLENIRKNHLEIVEGKSNDFGGQPVVVWLGYNVHGNEASAGESSLLTAYYLAAIQGDEATKIYENAVFLMEPIVNPDGRDRFNNWVNMHKGEPNVTDPNDREHNEVWPSGRVNHYWFDLNRDWYLAVHKESRNRLNYYHQWMPNVVTDFHEMGTNSTHFFEPTKSNAENPLVTQDNYKLLNSKFAKYFENAMNEIGSFYYTKESFDNFYPGYGSSYPDMQGGLGLLFEQGSSRGHAQDSENGVLTFKFAVRNQLTNAIATIQAAVEERKVLLKHQSDFFKNIEKEASKNTLKGYVIGDDFDQNRNKAFWDLLLQHRIKAYQLKNDTKIGDATFKKGNAVFIPLNQPQSLLVRSIFERPKSFADSVFYDTSTWNLALAFGLKHAEVKTLPDLEAIISQSSLTTSLADIKKTNYAYLIDWRDYNAAKALYDLLSKDVLVKVAMKSFAIGGKPWTHGTLMVPVQSQKVDSDALLAILNEVQKFTNVEIVPVNTGFSTSGIDLGSNFFKTVTMPKTMVLAGQGTSQYEVGEVWHLLETKLNMPISKVDLNQFGRVNLSAYTHLVMVSGQYDVISDGSVKKIKDWVKQGGSLITLKTASEWAIKKEISESKLIAPDVDKDLSRLNYEKMADYQGAKSTGGAIFEVKIDTTHPIGFGFESSLMYIYRNNNTFLEKSKNRFATVSQYTSNSWISGYVHPSSLAKIQNSAAIISETSGDGQIVLFSDNPNFRGIWFGTNKLFFNALFFSNTLTSQRFGNEE